MKKVALSILRGFLLSLIVGCSSTGFLMASPDVVVYNSSYSSKYDPNKQIEIFDGNSPAKKYITLGRIEVGDTDNEWCIKNILNESKKLGADAAIIQGKVGAVGIANSTGTNGYLSTSSYGMIAIAIKYVEN